MAIQLIKIKYFLMFFSLESWTKYYSWTLFVNHKKIIQWVELTKIPSAAYVEVSCLMPTGAGLSRSPPSVKQKLLSAVMINTSGSPPLPVTPKEYYRDYPDTVSIIQIHWFPKNLSNIYIFCSTMNYFHQTADKYSVRVLIIGSRSPIQLRWNV